MRFETTTSQGYKKILKIGAKISKKYRKMRFSQILKFQVYCLKKLEIKMFTFNLKEKTILKLN